MYSKDLWVAAGEDGFHFLGVDFSGTDEKNRQETAEALWAALAEYSHRTETNGSAPNTLIVFLSGAPVDSGHMQALIDMKYKPLSLPEVKKWEWDKSLNSKTSLGSMEVGQAMKSILDAAHGMSVELFGAQREQAQAILNGLVNFETDKGVIDVSRLDPNVSGRDHSFRIESKNNDVGFNYFNMSLLGNSVASIKPGLALILVNEKEASDAVNHGYPVLKVDADVPNGEKDYMRKDDYGHYLEDKTNEFKAAGTKH